VPHDREKKDYFSRFSAIQFFLFLVSRRQVILFINHNNYIVIGGQFQ